MRRSQTTILKEYENFVKAFENVCNALDWSVKFKQDVERMLQVEIDGVTYTVGPQTNDSPEQPIYYLSVMVYHHGTRDEPPSEDETVLAESFRDPRRIIRTLVDAHWHHKRDNALQQDWIPEDEKEY